MTPTAPLLRARGLRKTYGTDAAIVRAVDGVDLDVAPGETVAIIGPAAAGSRPCCTSSAGSNGRPPGKSTSRGTLSMDQRTGARPAAPTAIGFVFQAFHLMDELTAIETWSCRHCWRGAHRTLPGRARRNCWNM